MPDPPPPPPAAAPLGADELDRRILAHRRAAGFARLLSFLAGPLALAILLAGGTALALRLTDRTPAPAAWLLAAGVVAACGVAAARARRGLPNRRDAAAALDTALRSGGLLMTLADRPADRRPAAWLARLEPRRDRWADARPPLPLGRVLKAAAVPAAFAILAWTVPVAAPPAPRTAVDRTAAGGRLTGELRDTLAALAAGGTADPADLAWAAADLEELSAAIGAGGPTGSQLEAADALRDRLLGAAATPGGEDGGNAAALAGGLARGADLLAGSGLLESDAVRDAAAAAGLRDPAELRDLIEMAGANAEQLSTLAEGLTAEQRTALAAAGARLAAGEDPAELVGSLPPDLLGAVGGAAGPPLPPTTSPPSAPPAFAPPELPFELPAAAGGAASSLLPPGLAAAGAFAGTLFGGDSGAAAPPRPAVAGGETAGAAAAPVAVPAAPSRKVAAGRPVPPRLRGVVRRYFSGQTPAPPAAD